MKQTIILFLFMLLTIASYSQAEATDIIYPKDGSAPISNCTIQKIENKNLVFYKKKDKSFTVEAFSVKRNGEYINLVKSSNESTVQTSPVINNEEGFYNGFTYNHYQDIQKRAQSQKNIGMGLTIGGAALFIIGVNMALNSGYDETTQTFDNESKAATAGLLELGGLISTLVGIPVWITGSVKYRKATEGMVQCKNTRVSWNIGTTQNGLGLVMRF